MHPLLDLHGLTGDEARLEAERWLRERAADGERSVVVVTGRGSRSSGPPVLRGEIDHLLAGLQGDVVERWELSADRGAFHVRLRPARVALRPSPDDVVLLRGVPPELRRRAEEALAELGIAPTPALVRAEALRIRADARED